MATFDILLPVLNCVRYLREAISSIQVQTFSDWRLLVLDHGSSDGSFELAKQQEEEDGRINVYSFPDAEGLAGLLNAGLEKCDCKYILRQDADDVAFPNRISLAYDHFRETPDLIAVGGNAVTVDASGKSTGYIRLPRSTTGIRAAFFFYNAMLHGASAINFAALKRYVSPYGRDILQLVPKHQSTAITRLTEDYLLFGQLALVGDCANLDVPLIKYRLHDRGVSTQNMAQQINLALEVSRFLADSFSIMMGVNAFDPTPFCNPADHVMDFEIQDYRLEYEQMTRALRHGLGASYELERELAFRWTLATRKSALMARRFLQFHSKYTASTVEWRTVRNWLLRGVRRGKYVYRCNAEFGRSTE